MYHILMKNYENNFFKIQILPRSLLLALLLVPVINNLEIIFTVSMSFYEYLRVFTSIYEYLRVFMNIFFYEYLRIYCILHDQSCLNYFCLSRSLLILFFYQWALILTFFIQKWLCYRMFGLGGIRIFIISTYRWVTRILMTLHDQKDRWNNRFMNIKVF